jgi:hypothetical protein
LSSLETDGRTPGDTPLANCLIALDAATGTRLWRFQTVRHDVWDKDLTGDPLFPIEYRSCPRLHAHGAHRAERCGGRAMHRRYRRGLSRELRAG